MLRLRLRLPEGGTAAVELRPDAPLAALGESVAAATGKPAEELQLSSGFPPRPIALGEEGGKVGDVLQNMETVTVAFASKGSGQAVAAPGSKQKPPRPKKTAASSSQGSGASPGGVVTLTDLSSGGASSKKRKSPSGSGGGSGGKRRAPKALHLGSKDGIGEGLAAAVSSKKGANALHREDPAMAFFKAAAGSALAHHQEEVRATERYKAALAGDYEIRDADGAHRADGTPSECAVQFKVGRKWVSEAFEILALPELRGVIEAVLALADAPADASASGDADGGAGATAAAGELLKPFKMALVSPRTFWNLVRHFGGDVAAGLRELLPQVDWSFLTEREKRRSDKAEENARQAAQAKAVRERRAAARRAKAAPVPAPAEEAEAEEEEEEEEAEAEGEEEEAEEAEEDGVAEEEPATAAGWEERGCRAMLRELEYDYACVCLNRALELRIDAAGGDEEDAGLARPWYLHGSALLRRAQAMSLLIAKAAEGGEASADAEATRADLDAARADLGPEWEVAGSDAIGRRVHRFFALHGLAEGTVLAWQRAGEDASEPALWRVVLDDGDAEDLEEAEVEEAVGAAREGRTLEGEIELVLEAAWEALEMSIALYGRAADGAAAGADSAAHERAVHKAEAHERLADAALLNAQPQRALAEYTEARAILHGLRSAGSLGADDRRLADIDFYLGMAQLQLGDRAAAAAHYRQAVATLKLRRANLQKSQLEAEIENLAREVAEPAAQAAHAAAGASAGPGEEVAQIGELIGEIGQRLEELAAAA